MANRVYEFTVEGTGSFPGAMLSRDQCYPVHAEDVDNIFSDEWKFTESIGKTRRIQLRAARKPTSDRWKSFGWPVIEGRFI